ncbi:hypothetical protein OFN64_23680, partial [Escherichia coli]|nr:hypothetical protein [Escherichia coli]
CMSLLYSSRIFPPHSLPGIPKKPVFAGTCCVFAKAVCGWGVSDDGDRTRENSATGEDTSFLSGRLGSGTSG